MTPPNRERMPTAPDRAEEGQLRLAVLIDADNAQASVIEALLAEVARFGDAIVRRIYGDFTKSTSSAWKKVLQRNSIKPVQQFAYSTGKNATDSALIIDAMDLLYTGNFDGFCLVTSDSDFTGLATRLREAGLVVFGFGERKTPEAFRNACHRFVFVEVLRETAERPSRRRAEQTGTGTGSTAGKDDDGQTGADQADGGRGKQRSKKSAAPAGTQTPPEAAPDEPEFPHKFVLTALEHSVDDSGWAELGTFGRYLMKLQPDFDSRLYGYKKLSDLVRDRSDLFLTEERRTEGSGQRSIYVRAK